MYTTTAYYLGNVKPQHKGLHTREFGDGYSVNEKGVLLVNEKKMVEIINKRFGEESDLLAVDIIGDTNKRLLNPNN